MRVLRERVDQLLARLAVLVVADRFPRGPVVVIACEQATQFGLQHHVARGEQSADRGADQRDRVHRRDRVIQRRRVQHPPAANQTRRLRGLQHRLEDPVRLVGRPKPGAHIDQHRMRERWVVERQATAAYFHLASNANRSTASRSEQPSNRCNTITTATIIGGTQLRPESANRSANISSGNSRKHSRCNNP